ncbi:MAG TPA: hypothetical protein VJB16_01525, partial [archaeon]|nr:hypothetical protein [archaeon]
MASAVRNLFVHGNTITVNSDGIRFEPGATISDPNVSVRDNTIIINTAARPVLGVSCAGILNANSTIAGNAIRISGDNGSVGISLSSCWRANVSQNTVSVAAPVATAFALLGNSTNYTNTTTALIGNSFTAVGASALAIRTSANGMAPNTTTAGSHTLFNLTVVGNLLNGSNTTNAISNGTFLENITTLLLANNTFSGALVTRNIGFLMQDNDRFQACSWPAPCRSDIDLRNVTRGILTNVTGRPAVFHWSGPTNGNITVRYYLKVRAQNSSGTPLANAIVTVTNTTLHCTSGWPCPNESATSPLHSVLTDANGETGWLLTTFYTYFGSAFRYVEDLNNVSVNATGYHLAFPRWPLNVSSTQNITFTLLPTNFTNASIQAASNGTLLFNANASGLSGNLSFRNATNVTLNITRSTSTNRSGSIALTALNRYWEINTTGDLSSLEWALLNFSYSNEEVAGFDESSL